MLVLLVLNLRLLKLRKGFPTQAVARISSCRAQSPEQYDEFSGDRGNFSDPAKSEISAVAASGRYIRGRLVSSIELSDGLFPSFSTGRPF